MKNLTLVLNADDTPLNIASAYRAFNLVDKGKATLVTYDEENPIVWATGESYRPTIIRLNKYIYVPFRKAMPLTRHNIYKRDGHKCVYCDSPRKLTLDHVIPKSRGGKNSWKNLVTCCSKCNSKKDNKTPEEAGMKLRRKPYAPNYVVFVTSGNAHEHWIAYFEDKKKYYN